MKLWKMFLAWLDKLPAPNIEPVPVPTPLPQLPMDPPKPVSAEVFIMGTLAWGSGHPTWDKALLTAVCAEKLRADVVSPCPNLSPRLALVHAISIMAKYESDFKPSTQYVEKFADAQGKRVVSRGLLQLSQESVNQKVYGCPHIADATELHDPIINLRCAVKIAAHWINRDGVFFGDEKSGLGRYWSVGRKSSGSNAKILAYLKSK